MRFSYVYRWLPNQLASTASLVMRLTEPSHEVAQHWRFILKLQAIYMSGPVLESHERISNVVHVVIGIDPAWNGQTQEFRTGMVPVPRSADGDRA